MPVVPQPSSLSTAIVHCAADPAEPVIISFTGATIELLVAPKTSVPKEQGRIDRHIWGVTGAYVLLGPATEGGAAIRARPGQSSDVLNRVEQHIAESEWFTRAVLARDTRQGWNSAEAGYIEGRLHRLCRESPGIEHAFRRDQDRTLQEHEEALLENQYMPAFVAALRLIGVPINGGHHE
jgi:hypothetical protein